MALAKSVMIMSRNASRLCQTGGMVLTVGSRHLHAPRSLCLQFRPKMDSSFISFLGGRSFLTSSRVLAESSRQVQTQSDLEMSGFLREEIRAEKESLKSLSKAVQVKGFDVTTNEAEVKLKKNFQGEQITVTVNVNHAVDADPSPELADTPDSQMSEAEKSSMVCKPNFSVELTKGAYTLTFNCSMPRDDESEAIMRDEGSPNEPAYQDLFNIDEFAIHKGEIKDSTYAMSGDVMDGSFYENLMNMLDERGINSDFVHELIDFCTLYEQKLYVNLLEHLQDIVKSH